MAGIHGTFSFALHVPAGDGIITYIHPEKGVVMRKRLYEIIEAANSAQRFDLASLIYDLVIIAAVLLSIFPLALKEEPEIFVTLDKVCAGVFIVDYLLRLSTADYKYGRHRLSSFLRYPFSPWAIVDMLSILPSFSFISRAFSMARAFRLLRAFRIFKVFRYSTTMRMLTAVFRESRRALTAVFSLAVGYILLSALAIYSVEGDTFDNFFEAVYWATVSLTTMGYGDIYPVTILGRVVTMLSSLVGIAIVALPSGIITAGYIKEVNKRMVPHGQPHVEALSTPNLQNPSADFGDKI